RLGEVHIAVIAEHRDGSDHGANGGQDIGDEVTLGHGDAPESAIKREASLSVRARSGKPGACTRSCGAGFILADGGGNHTQAVAPTPLAGINPAPQKKCVQSATVRDPAGPIPCGAGFMPADGGGNHTQAVAPTPLAGINPAPHRPCENSSAPY